MKRIISLLLALCLIFLLAACGEKTGNPDATTEQMGTTQIETTQNTTTVETNEGGEETTQTTEPETQPSQGAILETKPGNGQSQTCKHSYSVTATKESTCSVAGTKTHTCSKCGSSYTEALALKPHDYEVATCTTPKKCKVCSATDGQPLGHTWNKYDYCTVCGVKNTQLEGAVTFKATVKSDENLPIKGITVSVYTTSATQPAGSAKTDSKGVATVSIERHSSYKVILTDVPKEYAVKESYSFTGTTVTINLKTEPVYDPLDHSKARYKEGDTMADFTLTDVDGNTFNLIQLRKKKKLIILDFWYVNCGPCKSEFPYFEKAVEQYGEKIEFLALNPLDSEENIRQLRQEIGVDFTMIKENLGMAAGFNVSAYPTTVIIDNTGKIRSIHRGTYDSEAAFLRAIEKFL